MVSIKQSGQIDGNLFNLAAREVDAAFGEPMTVKRWTGKTGGDQLKGIAATDTYLMIRATATVKSLQAKDVYFSGSIYVPGDVQADFLIPVYGAEAQQGDNLTPGHRPDTVIYRNREYYFVGHVDRKKLNSRWYWVGVLRQKGS